MLVAEPTPSTRTGVLRLVVLLSPSWPMVFRPPAGGQVQRCNRVTKVSGVMQELRGDTELPLRSCSGPLRVWGVAGWLAHRVHA